jgi:CubicO group peptidase (beta-lactamase class C family)
MTLLQRRGKIVHFGQYGLMDIEAKKPIQEDVLFRVYSMTKPIVSVALMILLEEGRLSLKDPVSTYIPEFSKTKVCTGSGITGLTLVEQQPQMTLHHLLTHTAGLSYGWFFDSPVDGLYRQAFPSPSPLDLSLQAFVERLTELPLLFQPGTQWRYSMATDVVGYVVQIVSAMPLDEFLKQRIFKPLGMTDTDFYVPTEKVNRLAAIYASETLYNPRLLPPSEVFWVGDVTQPTRMSSGGGGLVSTLADYLKFCACLLNKGVYEGGRLLSHKTLDWMTANHTPTLMPLKIGLDVLDHGFGLGFSVRTNLGQARNLSSVGEYGWFGAAQTYFWIDPAEDFIGLMMTQHMPIAPYPVQDRFRNLAYQAIVD